MSVTMKQIVVLCLFVLLYFIPEVGFSQKEVEISGVKYMMHTVKRSETVYSLCQKYKVSQKDLLQANPGLTTILKTGSKVKIPIGIASVTPVIEEIKPQPSTDEEYYYHKVSKKQTIFSIAKQYGVTGNDLIRYNTELTKGLIVGQVLKIPVSITNSANKESGESSSVSGEQTGMSDYTVHPVVSGETLYSLELRYGLTHEEMLKNNPALQSGLKAGMKLKIPVKPVSQPDQATSAPHPVLKNSTSGDQLPMTTGIEGDSDTGICHPVPGLNTKKYKVGLLLPLYLSGNDKTDPVGINKALVLSKISLNSHAIATSTDTSTVINGTNIDQKAVSFLEFYEGALLAIDSLQRKGMNIELYVFDESNQQMISSLLQLDEFRELNLIIGPVYPEFQESVASFAAKNRIPMISPLSSSGNFEKNNSWYFKVQPDKEYQMEQTAAYMASEFTNRNFILLQLSENSTSPEARLAQLSKDMLEGKSGENMFHEYNFQKQGVNAIKPLLDETGENIFVVPTDNEAHVSVTVTNLTALAEHYNIVLMGTPGLPKLKSIPAENYHRIRLRYLSPYFVDYSNPLVRRFVGQYRETFSAEPTQFSFQGFDVSYYFLSAMHRYGQDFRSCLPDYPMELTQMAFNFRRVSPMGGFMNHGLFVTSYERNFDVLKFGIFGGHPSYLHE